MGARRLCRRRCAPAEEEEIAFGCAGDWFVGGGREMEIGLELGRRG